MQFTREFFESNRQRLLEVTQSPLIVITANGQLQRSADTTFSFRQDSNFWYLTGINEADFVLVITPGETFLIEPKRAEHRDLWDGAIDKKALTNISGIDQFIEHHAGWTKLDMLIKKAKKAHTPLTEERYFEHFGFYANPARLVLLEALRKHRSLEIVDIRKVLASMRQIKQPVELAVLQRAIDITAETLEDVRKRLSSYTYEYQVVADISHGFISRGAMGHAYQPIVACGQNAATIHYIDNKGKLDASQLLLLDVGAEVENYSADITRTFALAKPTARQEAIYKAVMRVQQVAYDLLKPGATLRAYEQAVDEAMAKELQTLGLLDDIKDRKKLKKYYPHLTSHHLGLDTHDSADYERPLEPGMVLTVEPGIYIPEEGIGIRIEDDIVITKTGNTILSAALPSSLI